MVSRYAANPNCGDCGNKKGPNQVNGLRCFKCKNVAARNTKNSKHAAHIQNTYGISLALYNFLLAYQGGKCAICARANGRTRRLAVDHNHGCNADHPKAVGCQECVRGLLCGTCNTYIGRVRDDPTVGERMAVYLRDPPFQLMLLSMN